MRAGATGCSKAWRVVLSLLTAGCAHAPQGHEPPTEAPRPPPPPEHTQSKPVVPPNVRPGWDDTLAALQQIRKDDPSTFVGVDFATGGDCALLVRAHGQSTVIDMNTLHFTTLNIIRRVPEPLGQVAYSMTVASDHGSIEFRTESPKAAFRISNALVYLGQLCGSTRPMW